MNDERTSRRFVYAGRLLTVKGTLCPGWIDELSIGLDPEEWLTSLLPKAKASVVGGIYTIDFTTEDSYFPGSVSWTGESVERDIVLLLEAKAQATGVRHAQMTLERNEARSSELKELCAPLRELVAKQVSWSQRAALIAYITSEISRG